MERVIHTEFYLHWIVWATVSRLRTSRVCWLLSLLCLWEGGLSLGFGGGWGISGLSFYLNALIIKCLVQKRINKNIASGSILQYPVFQERSKVLSSVAFMKEVCNTEPWKTKESICLLETEGALFIDTYYARIGPAYLNNSFLIIVFSWNKCVVSWNNFLPLSATTIGMGKH
jgi:hypothetical protein